MKKLLATLLFLFLLSPLFGTIYYVDTAADAGGDGTTEELTGATCAWDTVADVNAATFSAGDIIKFNKGCTWREQLTVPSTGSSGSPITFTSYGTGNNPLLIGSTDADSTGTWSRYDSLGVLHASYFETGDTSEWDVTSESGSSTIAASTTEKNIGTYSAKFTIAAGDDATLDEANAFSDQSELYIRFYINFDSWTMGAGDACQLVYAYDDAPALYAQVKLTYTGGHYYIAFAIKDDGNTWQYVPGSGSNGYQVDGIVDGDWHELKFRFKAGTGADGIATLWYDGTQGGTSTTLDTDTRQLGDYKVGFIGVDAGTSGTVYIDDIIAASSDIVGTIWKTANSSYAADPVHVLYGTTPTRCSEETTYAGLSANWEWWYDATNDFVAIYQDTNNPATVATGLEIPTRQYCIDIAGTKDYITTDGIDCKYAYSNNIMIRTDSIGSVTKNLTSSYSGATGVYLQSGNQTFDIDNVTTAYTWMHGISAISCTAGTIQNCDISYWDCQAGAGTHAVSIPNSSNLLIEDNHFHDSYAGSTNNSGVGGDEFSNCTIQNNEIADYYQSGVDLSGTTGDECYENIVRYNLIHDGDTTLGAAIQCNSNSGQVNGSYDNEIYYNIIYNDKRGVMFAGDVRGNIAYNNVIYNMTNEGLQLYDNDDMPSDNIAKNNIVHTCGTKLISVSAGLYGEGNVTDYNCFYDASFTNKFKYGASTTSTLTAFQAASSQDANSIDDDPLMTDPASDDFTLQYLSPCIDAGKNVALTQDYAGISILIGNEINPLIKPRLLPVLRATLTNKIDIGAYEYWD